MMTLEMKSIMKKTVEVHLRTVIARVMVPILKKIAVMREGINGKAIFILVKTVFGNFLIF